MIKAPTNIHELTASIAQLFADIGNEAVKANIAKEMNNSAGKIVATIKVQLEYSALRKEAPNIAWLAPDVETANAIDKAKKK